MIKKLILFFVNSTVTFPFTHASASWRANPQTGHTKGLFLNLSHANSWEHLATPASGFLSFFYSLLSKSDMQTISNQFFPEV